jgi:hypothetical protein
MTHTFEFARRAARLRALFLVALATVLGACNATDNLTSASDDPTLVDPASTTSPTASFATMAYRGGIPMGLFALPTSQFGGRFNGAMRNIWPGYLQRELAAIRARGGKVVLMLAGNERYYKDAQGHFDFNKWKARINRFKGIDFSSYVRDGTVIGHYLIDEPYDPFNWHGRPVPGSTLEAMAKYSKQIWPQMATIVRAEPYLIKWSGRYQYLDAAWAQYLYVKGDAHSYIQRNVSEAQKMGLALIVGLNLRDGGRMRKTAMRPTDVVTWGTALLSSSYPCAFISWYYNPKFLTSSMMSAMGVLSGRAQGRSMKSCRSS